ncbi:MAG: hypothetical protein ABIR39_12185 [Nocardioides sp.]|uniref:hypothetical protein n=1 Tax=Nocardioides sp. TaxID=35761 RepID=UPI003264C8EA
MELDTLTRYTDDPDRFIDRTITQGPNGLPLTFTVMVGPGPGAYTIAATWLGAAGPERVLRVPVSTLTAGTYHLYGQVPGSNDLDLGWVQIIDRT